MIISAKNTGHGTGGGVTKSRNLARLNGNTKNPKSRILQNLATNKANSKPRSLQTQFVGGIRQLFGVEYYAVLYMLIL